MIDQDLLTEVQYALLEPPDGGQSWPSEVWSRDEVVGNLNTNLWGWLRDTHAILTRAEIPVPATNTGLVALPADWMATAWCVWQAGDGTRRPLGKVDRFEADLAIPTWEGAGGVPIGVSEFEGDTLTLQLVPIPAEDGTLELLYVARPPALLGAGATIAIPEEFCSGVKYGLLGMLLRKVGRLADPDRAAYCEQRYDLTVLLTKILLSGWA